MHYDYIAALARFRQKNVEPEGLGARFEAKRTLSSGMTGACASRLRGMLVLYWVRKELRPHVAQLGISNLRRMGWAETCAQHAAAERRRLANMDCAVVREAAARLPWDAPCDKLSRVRGGAGDSNITAGVASSGAVCRGGGRYE